VRAVDILESHQFYGKGEAELLSSLQEEQTTLRRMVIDRNHLDIDKSFLMSNRETELDEEDLIAHPHMIIPVDDPANVKPLEYGDIPRSVFLSLDLIRDDAVRVTGQDDRAQSVSSVGTATEAAIVKEATLKRLSTKLWLLRNLTLYEIGVLREANIRQYYTVPKIEEIVGDKASKEYRAEIRQAYRLGRLKMIDGKPYRERYRTVRMNSQMLVPTEKGLVLRKSKEPSFFEASPELITPRYGSFDIKIEPTPDLPVSKPLQQERTSMMYDRLIQNPSYSPEKLGDALLEAHDYDPDEFKPEPEGGAQERFSSAMIDKSIELATAENDELLRGEKLPPTPMVQEPHTEVHIALIESPQVMELPPESPILANIIYHIQGELEAQKQRSQVDVGVNPQQAGQQEAVGYKPPSGPTAIKQRGNIAVPAVGEREQLANLLASGS
jgi:hypothetical protein